MDLPTKSQPKIQLYRGFPIKPAYTWSPFVTKLEARLRFDGVSYQNAVGSPPKGPRGKIPYIAISTSTETTPLMLGDTKIITEYLIQHDALIDLNASLDPVKKAHDLAFRALLEDKLYWYQVRR